MSGYFGIGVERGKNAVNVGTLWRSAHAFGAAFVFTVGRRYERQTSDVFNTWTRIPLFNFADVDDLLVHSPMDCRRVAVEVGVGGKSLPEFKHPSRAVYLLGPEDGSISEASLEKFDLRVTIPGGRCLNVASAGTVVLYDRIAKEGVETFPVPMLGRKRGGK